jgi:hypothetical protein
MAPKRGLLGRISQKRGLLGRMLAEWNLLGRMLAEWSLLGRMLQERWLLGLILPEWMPHSSEPKAAWRGAAWETAAGTPADEGETRNTYR